MSRFLSAILALALAAPVYAGGDHDHGHDHGDAAPLANANGPQRLADGSVFLPKPAQRQLGVRTVLLEAPTDLPQSVTLPGTVVMDPNAGGTVQSLYAGRLEPGPSGLPLPGQTVDAGAVLAFVVAARSPQERAAQAAELAELRAAQTLARQQLARLRTLTDTVPRRRIEAAESAVESLSARIAALAAGEVAREPLRAPIGGVIASGSAVAGQVIEAGQTVWTVVDPGRLVIEALAYEPALATRIAGATLVLGDGARATPALGVAAVPLTYVGAARTLRGQALPLSFRAQAPALATLAIGQPVEIVVQLTDTVRGIAIPQAALMKNAANQPIVWVKTAAERYAPRVVSAQPLDGLQVAVTAGLVAGDRVATQGATLIQQVR
jgi:cobalt-zinc-cadmium efflux system membrane fusion protein